ncbi:MAG: T9SS type A sorting domain-containing protein [Bacteroidales bacterium]|nr:T9SS type A sorting domain-containing protein [Bacteroidales bacterium]
MRTYRYFLPVLIFIGFTTLKAQQLVQKATLIVEPASLIEVPSIASQMASGNFIPAQDQIEEVNPKRRDANKAVPGKGFPKGSDPLWHQQQKAPKIKGKEPILSFEAVSANVTPTDPTGAVGPNHFLNSWNSSFRIWDKTGNPLTPPASLATIFPGQTLGDPIVMYDPFADRFFISEFYSNGFLVAVSQGPDPVNDGWYTYQYPTNTFPDYPKYSIWSDGYYITANKNSGSAGFSEVVFAIERDKILQGDPTALMIGFPLPTINTSGFYSPLGFNVSSGELPPPGNAPIVYMQDDSWSGVSTDHLKIWSINVNWDTPNNSTISNPQVINTIPFDGLFDGGSFSNLPQPSGPDIDALQATIMYMAQYRRFSGHNSVVFNFVVDLDGSDDLAGIRWYELRQDNDGDPWQIYQEGTYAQPDGHSAFSGNMCMDSEGNIALAYTAVSESLYPSLRFTGRYSTDPLNVMTIEEDSYAEGTNSNPSYRYGDYSQMTIDPTDDKTFWSIGEYFTGGSRKNQVGVFKIASDLANDVGVVSIDSPVDGILSDSEPVTVTIRNFGVATQTSIPVSFQINGGPVINDVFTGSLASNNNAQFTFAATGNFSEPGATYHIFSQTSLGSDLNIANDTVSTWVKHLFADDIGVTEIISPVSGIYLTNNETVTVNITNFGALAQNDFDVTYVLNDGTPVTEQVDGPLELGSTLEYSFSTTADFSEIGYHELMVTTTLAGDADNTNDTTYTTVINSLCQPQTMCEQGVGIFELQLGSIDNESGCAPDGYANYTNMSTNLTQGSSNDLTISTGYGSVYVKVWIDFNDNFVFDEDEIVVNDYVIANGQGQGTYTETMPLDIPADALLGEHLMRAKTNYNVAVPADACESTTFGETEDYVVNVVMSTGLSLQELEPNELVLRNTGDNHFVLSFDAKTLTETLIVSVHNIQGHRLINNRVNNLDGKYKYDFDMSYVAPGIYLLRLGSATFGKVKRFVVE